MLTTQEMSLLTDTMPGLDEALSKRICVNCDQPIEPDDGGAIWYHAETMEAFCDPEGEHDVWRQAEPGGEGR
jgi:hypothetical protein